jgi:hypothetical protein
MEKKEKFKLGISEKSARLDVRIAAELREKVEGYSRKNRKRLTTVVITALEEFLDKHRKK